MMLSQQHGYRVDAEDDQVPEEELHEVPVDDDDNALARGYNARTRVMQQIWRDRD
jgi:hypothetical protein